MHHRPIFLALLAMLLCAGTLQAARWVKDLVYLHSETTGKVPFSHYAHLELLGRDCTECHNRIFHIDPEKNPPVTMAEMEQGQSCGVCHNGVRTFSVSENCQFCHPTAPATFEVPDAGDVIFSHDAHLLAFGCSDCHPDLFRPDRDNPPVTMSAMAEGEYCGACHDGSTTFSVEENCDFCHQM